MTKKIGADKTNQSNNQNFLYCAILTYGLGDTLTTIISQLIGIEEANPLWHTLFTYSLVFGIVILVLYKIVFLYVVRRLDQPIIYYAVILLGGLVIVGNTHMIGVTQGWW